jgi:cbb3-type cytochrome oxidase subunit 3
MDAGLLDNLFVFFALVFYAFLFFVYVLRARELWKLEWKLRFAFSVQLIPFASLWVLNLYSENDSGRLLAGLPIIIYLAYDLWYRLLTKKKPYHHPERWPAGLVVYLILLFVGSIGLNWYGYLMSQFYGNILVIAFFIMMSFYGYYQYTYNKRRKANNSQKQ